MGYMEIVRNFVPSSKKTTKEMNEVDRALAKKIQERESVNRVPTKNMGVYSKVVAITPAIAEDWLKKMGKNRRTTPSFVKKYAKDMAEGNWVLNGESIKFSIDGFVIDGKHRLEAVIDSGVTILSLVVWGIRDEKAFSSIDTGRKRTADQLVDIAFQDEISGKLKNSKIITSVAKRLLMWEMIDDKSEYFLGNSLFYSISGQAIIDYLYVGNNLLEIQWMLEELKQSMPYKRCGAGSSLVAAMVILHRQNHLVTMDFIEKLVYGADLKKKSPVILLRDKLLASTVRNRSRIWGTEVMALTIKAWNKHAKDETAKILTWRWDGDAPEKFPIPRSDV